MFKICLMVLLLIAAGASYCYPHGRFKDGLPLINSLDLDLDKKRSFADEELILNVSSREGNYFNAKILAQDVVRLKKFYFDRGYFKVMIDTSVTADLEDNEVDLKIVITENERHYIREVEILGLDSIQPVCRSRIFSESASISAGMPYEKAKIDAEAARITFLLQSYGHAFADKQRVEIENVVTGGENSNQNIVVRLNFRPGEIYYFGKTEIEFDKNSHGITASEITRYFKFREGERFDRDKLNRTEGSIGGLPIVEIVKFEPAEIKDNVINYKLKVRLRNKYELKPELAFYEINNELYGGAGIEFRDRHFFGGGRTFRGSVINLYHSPEINIVEAEVEVMQPYLFGKENVTGNLSINGTYTNLDIFSLAAVSYLAGIGLKFPKHTYFNELTFDWELSDLYFKINVPIVSEDGTEVIEPSDINVFLSTLGVTLRHDNVNALMFPTSGFYQALELKESGLMGSLFQSLVSSETYKYFQARFLNRYFTDLTGNGTSILAARFLAGAIFDYDGTLELLNTKFTSGGPSSHRGWRSKSLGMFENKEIGGNFILEGSVEHRFNPFSDMIGYIKDLGFVTFMDNGNVWSEVKDFRWDQIAISAGAGIRYYTMVGAVRLDLGFKIYDPRPGHVGVTKWIFEKGANIRDKYTIQIGIGNTF